MWDFSSLRKGGRGNGTIFIVLVSLCIFLVDLVKVSI